MILCCREGALAGLACVWHGTAKDRKAIIKSFKTFVTKIATEEHGHLVLLGTVWHKWTSLYTVPVPVPVQDSGHFVRNPDYFVGNPVTLLGIRSLCWESGLFVGNPGHHFVRNHGHCARNQVTL